MATLAEIRESQLQEASLSLTNGAANLTQVIIDRMLLESQRKYAPLRRVFARKTWKSKEYRWNTRLTLPDADTVTEAPPTSGTGSVPATNSSYTQGVFPIKHLQSQLDIAKFSAEVANVNGNLYDLELAGAAKALAYREEVNHLYGNAACSFYTNHPDWDGIDFQVANSNKLDAGGNVIAIQNMDDLIDSITGVSAEELGDGYCYVMGTRMQSAVNRLFQAQERFNVGTTRLFQRDDYGVPNGEIANNGIDAGVEVQTYRGIPIVKSSFLGNVGVMSAVSASAAGSGSLLAGATFYYVVEAITRNGLTAPCTEVNATATAGQNITLSWSTPTILDVLGQPVKISGYRIFRSNTTGTETLYATLAAKDINEAAIVSFVDSGTPATAGPGVYYATFNQSAGAAIPDGVTYPRTLMSSQNVQDIFLVPRSADFCVVPVFKEVSTVALAPVNARSTQFAEIADLTLALRAPAFAAKLQRVRYK